MLWMALRWNWANTLPIAAFSLLSIVAIGGGWMTDSADVSPVPVLQTSPIAALPADLRQGAAVIALNAN